MPLPDPAALLNRLTARPGREHSLTHLARLPARVPRHSAWPTWLHPGVRSALERHGIQRPWVHQVEAAEAAFAGRHVVLSTGTASGKSLGYLMPALTAIADARGPRGQRRATALYLAPAKALAHDQAAMLTAMAVPDLRVATHDGDSPAEQREWSRDHAEYLLTNPDMLHYSLLPGHERWSGFWRSLRFVVVDEVHHYRGVFGAHVAQVMRRLQRICAAYGASPTFVLASATVAEPTRTATRLLGVPEDTVTAATDDAAPRGATGIALWEPPLLEGAGEGGAPTRRSAVGEAADLLVDLVVDGARTLVFTRSRRGAEAVALSARRQLAEVAPELVERVAAYRGGYLPEERREIERRLRDGDLVGLAATTALELGIDVSGLDAVVVAGFPGTRAAFWQQVGRAGRAGTAALGLLVARDDPLDTYLVHHPEALLGRPVEAVVFDPDNPHVLGPHLCAAASELPLADAGPAGVGIFGATAREAAEALTAAGLLRRRPQGWYWTQRRRACDLADLRSSGRAPVRLVEEATGRVVGTVDPASAPAAAHPGAVYLHQGESWTVTDLDLDGACATVVPADGEYITSAREVSDIRIRSVHRERPLPGGRLYLGEVDVSSQVVSYLRRRSPGGEVIGEVPLDLPVQTLSTQAVWWTMPDELAAHLNERDLPGAAHAAEHASIGLLPLFATCDRWDIGGVSTARHPDTGLLTVFVHDGHPGGAGFSERGFERADEWLTATAEAIAACECATGCPSCVQSPKCGNQNEPLDKAAARDLLESLLHRVPAAAG